MKCSDGYFGIIITVNNRIKNSKSHEYEKVYNHRSYAVFNVFDSRIRTEKD